MTNQMRHPLAKFHRRSKRLSCEYSTPLECAFGDHADGSSRFTDKFCSLRVMKVVPAAISQSLGALMAEMTIKQPDLNLLIPIQYEFLFLFLAVLCVALLVTPVVCIKEYATNNSHSLPALGFIRNNRMLVPT